MAKRKPMTPDKYKKMSRKQAKKSQAELDQAVEGVARDNKDGHLGDIAINHGEEPNPNG